jgi:diguanylate cyclase (GGDEF)-like protein
VVFGPRKLIESFLLLGNMTSNAVVAGRVRAIQIGAIRRYTPWMMGANIVNSLAVMAVFWGGPSQTLVVGWAATVCLLAAYMGFSWWQGRHSPLRLTASLRGIRFAVTYATLLGAIWGSLPAIFYSAADPNQKLVLISVIAGMACGSGFALATVTPAALMFAGMVSIGGMIALITAPSFASALIFILYACFISVILKSSLSLAATVTERVLAQVDSEEQRDVVSLLLNDFEQDASDWLWSIDKDLRLKHVSARYCDLVGKSESDLIGRDVGECLPTAPLESCTADEKYALKVLNRHLGKHEGFRDLDVPVELNGVRMLWSFTARPALTATGEFDGFRGVGRDVTAAREARRKIEHMAKYDALTGLPNRTLLREDIDRALSRLDRRGETFALLLLDLDHFKMINDTQGHPVGDALLIKVGEALKGLVREHDTVARLGGDEFAIILTMLETPKEAANFAERITKALSKPFNLGVCDAMIGVSIGIAYAPIDGTDADTLVRHSDLALYKAKNDGRGGYSFFEQEMDAAARRRHQLEVELRLAIENGGLQLYYQPQVHAATRRLISFEALVRWNHPTLGMLSPVEFIPLAEEVGLIQPLGAWVLAEACREAMYWPENIRIAVNLSPIQFRSPSLFDQVRTVLLKTGLNPDRLELEITESLLMDNTGLVESTLAALKGLGVRIALDDFGTGYSSLSYLRKYQFDKIKIDRSFVENIDSEPDSLAIVDAIIRLARDLRMSLTVEGVETDAQLTSLRSRGCEHIQGFLISKPAPANEIERFLHEERQESRAFAMKGLS